MKTNATIPARNESTPSVVKETHVILLDTAESLVRLADKSGTLVIGFMANTESPVPLIVFGNAQEQGADLAELFHQIGNLVSEKARNDLIDSRRVREPS